MKSIRERERKAGHQHTLSFSFSSTKQWQKKQGIPPKNRRKKKQNATKNI